MLLALHNPRFRLLWSSSVVNFVGLVFYFTVHGWLALEVTDSEFWVGATYGMNGLSLVLFSAGAGVLVDRLNRKKLILTALVCQASTAAAIAALIFTEQIHLWHILVVSFLDGTVMSFKVPSRSALVLDVVGRRNMLKATAATTTAATGAGIVTPPLAGMIIESHGIGWAYVLMGGAFVVSALILAFLRGVKRVERKSKTSPVQDFRDGVKYVFTTPAVRLLFLLLLSAEILGWAHESMMPVMAGKVLNAGPTGLGYLLSAGSAGALLASLVLSGIGDIRRKGLALIVGYTVFGVFLVLFALSEWLLLSLALIAIAYASATLYETLLETLLQTSVPNEMRGRVLSFQMFTWGVTDVSGFYTGAIAAFLGAPLVIAIGGGALVLNGIRQIRALAARYRDG